MPNGVDSPSTTPPREWGAIVFVGCVWLAATAGMLALGIENASSIPWVDDWDFVKPLTGDVAIRDWIWTPYINHRVALPRAILLGIYTLNNGDFRAAPIINVTVLSLLALIMVAAARRVRGNLEYTDAIFPLTLLNIDREILFPTLGVNLIPSTFLSCLILIAFLRMFEHPRMRTVVLVALMTLALTLCGSSGSAQVPFYVLWISYVGWRFWRGDEPTARKSAIVAWLLAAAVLLCLAFSFPSVERPESLGPHPGIKAGIRTSFEFLSTTFGPAALSLASEWFRGRPWIGVAVASLAMLTAGLLAASWIRQPAERFRIAGLLAVLAGMGVFALGAGWGRADPTPGAGYATRYTVYAAPLLFAIYFTWDLYGRPITSRLVPTALFFASCVVLVPNIGQSISYTRDHARQARAVERDLLAGLPPSLLAERHAEFLLTGEEFIPHLTECMKLLHSKGMGIFRELKDPEFAVVPFTARPAHLNQVVWKNGTAECTGNDPFLTYKLKEPTFLYAIRVRCCYKKAGESVPFQIYWRNASQDFAEEDRTSRTYFTDLMAPDAGADSPSLRELSRLRSALALVNDRIEYIRIDPADKPCEIKIEAIELIMPPEERDRFMASDK